MAAPRVLSSGHDADEKADAAAVEESHLWRSGKRNGQAKDIPATGGALLEVFGRDGQPIWRDSWVLSGMTRQQLVNRLVVRVDLPNVHQCPANLSTPGRGDPP